MVLKIHGLANGGATPFDGKFLKHYDPTKPGIDPNGEPMLATIECVDNPADAKHFFSAMEALEYWRMSYGTREDGRPNRPLTAFTVECLSVEHARL